MSFVNLNMIHSLQQCRTPLNTLFFSEFNIDLLQKAIRQEFKNRSNFAIDFQNKNDLLTIMRAVFVNNSSQPYSDTNSQIKHMNSVVIKKAIDQITTGVAQYVGYLKSIESPVRPIDRPVNTNMHGTRVGLNDQIGL